MDYLYRYQKIIQIVKQTNKKYKLKLELFNQFGDYLVTFILILNLEETKQKKKEQASEKNIFYYEYD